MTFDRPDAQSLLAEECVIHAHHPTNRHIGNLLRNFVLAVRVMRSVKPRAIVTTGAGIAVPFCVVGRLAGARVVYLESFTRITRPSLTGRLVAPFAHEFFVQWPELLTSYRRAVYKGSVFDLS